MLRCANMLERKKGAPLWLSPDGMYDGIHITFIRLEITTQYRVVRMSGFDELISDAAHLRYAY